MGDTERFLSAIVISISLVTILSIVALVALYIVLAIFLNKFHKLKYGKSTILAWIPICDYYILGKLAFNKNIGWMLVGILVLMGLLPEAVRDVLGNIYNVAIFVLFIYAGVKYNELKNSKKIEDNNDNNPIN